MNQFTTSGYVYAAKNEMNRVKIGKSVNPDKRISTIEQAGCVRFIEKYVSQKVNDYSGFESFLHKHFKKNRVFGEWFDVELKEVVDCIIKNVDRFNVPMPEMTTEDKPEETQWGRPGNTVKQAAAFLKVNEARVRQFIYAGRLPAKKVGRDLLMTTDDLKAFAAIARKTGRPTK